MCIKPHNWETLKRLLHEEDFLDSVVQISIWLLMTGMYAFSERQLLLNTPLSNVLTEALDSYALGSWLCLGRAVFFFDDSFTCVWWPCSCVWSVARLAGIDAPDGLKHVWLLFSCGQLSVDSGASVLTTAISSGAGQCRLAFKVVTKDQHRRKKEGYHIDLCFWRFFL